jgi:heat-inducible transcriptional repressor
MTQESSGTTLSNRQHALVLAAVQEFIATAEPVGSAQIVARNQLGVRAAMVRNMMAELEEGGYLRQPHTSAGRVPTEKAFRYYVDHLVAAATRIGFEDRAQIELHYSSAARNLGEVLRDTPKLLSFLTGQAALVMAPRLEASIIERVNFVRLRDNQVLAVFVASKGAMQNRIVDTDRDHSQDELDRMARYLNESLEGRTLDEARRWIEAQLHEERANYDRFMHDALALGEALADYVGRTELYVEGSLQAIEQPEFSDRDKMRELLRALDDKTALLELLERSLTHAGLTVSIGSENYDPRLSSLSVVAASYASGPSALGSLAIVGPMRMDYDRVIPLVEYTARALSRLIES